MLIILSDSHELLVVSSPGSIALALSKRFRIVSLIVPATLQSRNFAGRLSASENVDFPRTRAFIGADAGVPSLCCALESGNSKILKTQVTFNTENKSECRGVGSGHRQAVKTPGDPSLLCCMARGLPTAQWATATVLALPCYRIRGHSHRWLSASGHQPLSEGDPRRPAFWLFIPLTSRNSSLYHTPHHATAETVSSPSKALTSNNLESIFSSPCYGLSVYSCYNNERKRLSF